MPPFELKFIDSILKNWSVLLANVISLKNVYLFRLGISSILRNNYKTLRNINKIISFQNTHNKKQQFVTTNFVFLLFRSDQNIIK